MEGLSMIYGVISLMGAQFLALLLGAIIYSRQKSALDIEKRDRGTFGVKVDKALQQAHDALLGVERIDVEQYKALAKKLAEAYQEIEMLKVRVLAQDESIKSLSNKLASRDRADSRAAKEETKAPAPAAPGLIQTDILEELRAQGLALPVNPGGQAEPPTNRPSNFGRQLAKAV